MTKNVKLFLTSMTLFSIFTISILFVGKNVPETVEAETFTVQENVNAIEQAQ